MILCSRRMQPSAVLQKQLVSLMNALVRATVEEICKLDDVSALKPQNGAQQTEDSEFRLMKVTAALENQTKETVRQIIQLFCRLSCRAPAKVPLGFLKRQKMKRSRQSLETQVTRKRNSVRLISTAQPQSAQPTDEERILEDSLLSQTERINGQINTLFFSEDSTQNNSAGPFPQTVENPVLKLELDYGKDQEKFLLQNEIVEEGLNNLGESTVKPIRREENGAQSKSSDTLEIKISAAQSLDLNVDAKDNSFHVQGTHKATSKAPGGSCKETTAQKELKCDACGKVFTYLNNLKRHQKTFHSGETPHICKDCGERFGSKQLLRVHLREHRIEKPHACTVCEKVFRLPNHLKKHMTSHSNERPFTCTICQKTFALASTLKAHERTHSSEKTFVCKQCGMSFLTKSYLDYHQRVHTGEKPYTCMHCGKTFAQKSNLRVHERLHTGEKPFCCDVCGESFIHANSYKSHRQIHTGIKAFCCEHCGKGFRRGTHLKTHLLTHSGVKPFKCDLCSKTFALKGSLKAHRLTHTGEKSFVCNICNKSFTQASSLGKHKRTHTGEKPYRCSFCNKSFCQSSHLHYHYRASHPREEPQLQL
ncbi:gastrula zinc finger protein XlCGF57.1-like isoform X2 [Hoplias malabaricus]|uniref:gastrula zinc finger protein XlCGF57.1-like isoform X2 n=1 Tax=Hoplias malabaricus TaxID=27720 RepID=UPI003461C4E0